MDDEYYYYGNPTAIVVFIGCWIYCIFAYGFLFGVGLGWLPALIVAAIARVVWPILWMGAAIVAYLIYKAA